VLHIKHFLSIYSISIQRAELIEKAVDCKCFTDSDLFALSTESNDQHSY
jgi:hypothetical protein